MEPLNTPFTAYTRTHTYAYVYSIYVKDWDQSLYQFHCIERSSENIQYKNPHLSYSDTWTSNVIVTIPITLKNESLVFDPLDTDPRY